MSTACFEIVWLSGLLYELGFPQTDPFPLYGYNTSAIQIVANPVYHEHTKYIELDYDYIWEASLPHLSTNLQTTNVFIKALTCQ